MPLYDTGWRPISAGAYLTDIREDYAAALGTTPGWSQSVDGAWTFSSSELAFRVDQQGALLLSSILLATCPPAVAVARAISAGLTPRPATASRYTAEVPAGAAGTLEIGQLVEDPTGQRWQIVDIDGTTTGSQAVTAGDPVIVEATATGPITLSQVAPTTLTMVTPVTGIDELTYTNGDTFTVGVVAETTPELKARIQEARPGSDPDGVRARLRQIPWVVAADATFTPGYATCFVSPGPTGADQTEELARAIFGVVAGGIETAGAESTTITDDDGGSVTIRWEEGSTQAVAVVYTITLDGSVPEADALAAADAAIRAEFSALTQGETVRYLRVLASLDLTGIIGATLTLDGGTSDVTPSVAADVLTPSPLTGTVA